MGNSGTKSKPINSNTHLENNNNNNNNNVNNEDVQVKKSPRSVRKVQDNKKEIEEDRVISSSNEGSSPVTITATSTPIMNNNNNNNNNEVVKIQTIKEIPQQQQSVNIEPIRSVSPVLVPKASQQSPKSQQQQQQQEQEYQERVSVEEFSNRNSVDNINDFDNSSSVETFQMRDSVEMFESSIYQDRESDLAVDQSLQDFNDALYDDNNGNNGNSTPSSTNNHNNNNKVSSTSNNFSAEILLKRQNEENLAMEALRELCSPTVSYSLQSDQWAHRKEGLELIQKYIERNTATVKNMLESECNKEFLLFCTILRKYFLDRVAPVFYAAYDCFRALLKVYSPYVHGKDIEIMLKSLILPLLQNMGSECSGTNKRTQKEACRCILRIARLTSIDGLSLILTLFQSNDDNYGNNNNYNNNTVSTPVQQNQSQQFQLQNYQQQQSLINIKQKLMLLKILINEFSITESSNGNCGSGISTDLVLTVCQVGLNHSDDKVRKLSIDIIGLAYVKVGKNIKMYMTDIKPVMLKVLEKKFDEIDAQNNNNSNNNNNSLNTSNSSSNLYNESNSKSMKRKSSSSASISSSSFNNSSNNLNGTGGIKSENIRNLAPVVIKNGNSLQASNSRSKLLNSSFNSSFNGTIKSSISNNNDDNEGEENFVVMKNPTKKDRDILSNPALSNSLSTSNSVPNLNNEKKNPSISNLNKENDSNSTTLFSPNKSLNSRLNNGIVNNNNVSNSSKNRFEIIDSVESFSSNSPLNHSINNSNNSNNNNNINSNNSSQHLRKDKKGSSSTSSKNQSIKPQSSYEDNRFCIDESQF